jgi:hypothetical protein
VAPRKPFLLRVPPELYAALEKWAADELRSVNGQIEFLLATAVKEAGRTVRPRPDETGGEPATPPTEES